MICEITFFTFTSLAVAKVSESYDDGYTTIARSNAAAFVIGDKAYISTGVNNGTLFPYTWEYDFASDLWIYPIIN